MNNLDILLLCSYNNDGDTDYANLRIFNLNIPLKFWKFYGTYGITYAHRPSFSLNIWWNSDIILQKIMPWVVCGYDTGDMFENEWLMYGNPYYAKLPKRYKRLQGDFEYFLSKRRDQYTQSFDYTKGNSTIQVTCHYTPRRIKYAPRILHWSKLLCNLYNKFNPSTDRKFITMTFDTELGEEAGTYKGGVLGYDTDILSDETPQQTFERFIQTLLYQNIK